MTPEKKRYEEHLLKYCPNLCCSFHILEYKFVYAMYLVSTYICLKQYIIFDPIKIATNRTKEKFMTMILILGGLNLED